VRKSFTFCISIIVIDQSGHGSRGLLPMKMGVRIIYPVSKYGEGMDLLAQLVEVVGFPSGREGVVFYGRRATSGLCPYYYFTCPARDWKVVITVLPGWGR